MFRELETERLWLKRYHPDYLQDAFALYRDAETMRMAGPPVHTQISETYAFIEEAIRATDSLSMLVWALIEKKTGHLLGDISLTPDFRHRFASTAMFLNRQYQQSGFMYEAAIPVLNFGFLDLKLNRIEAQVCTLHKASCKLLEKLGFECEGELKMNFLVEGDYLNSFLYAKLNQMANK